MLTKEFIQSEIVQTVNQVRRKNPMAGSITNTVTINFVANAQLAVGGSAAMVYLPDEAELLAKAGEAMYINVGTLLPIYETTLPLVANTLYETKKHWVLDPVAVGIGKMRTDLLKQFKNYKPSVVRGNASEIIALASLWQLIDNIEESNVRGVDSTDSVSSAKEAAIKIAQWTNGAVAVSGEIDLITDGKTIVRSYGGSDFLQKITGAGCSLAGITAIYLTESTPFIAALTATNAYNVAGKIAEANVEGPASFQQCFLDQLYQASAEQIANNQIKIMEV